MACDPETIVAECPCIVAAMGMDGLYGWLYYKKRTNFIPGVPAYLTDEDGNYLTDEDGNRIVVNI